MNAKQTPLTVKCSCGFNHTYQTEAEAIKAGCDFYSTDGWHCPKCSSRLLQANFQIALGRRDR